MTDFKVTDEAVEAAARVIAEVRGEDFDSLGVFTQNVLKEVQRAAIEAALPVMLTKVGYATVQRWKGIDSAINYDFDYIGDLPDGTYCVYALKESK